MVCPRHDFPPLDSETRFRVVFRRERNGRNYKGGWDYCHVVHLQTRLGAIPIWTLYEGPEQARQYAKKWAETLGCYYEEVEERRYREEPKRHFAIIGVHTNKVIGVCLNKQDVLTEEPGATFWPITQEQFEQYRDDTSRVVVEIETARGP